MATSIDEHLHWIVEFTVNKGKKEEFKKLAREMSDTVRRSEPGAKRYEWFFNDKINKCIVVEYYNSSVAGIAHSKGSAICKIFPQLLKIAKVSRFDVCGNPTEELLKELADVRPSVYQFLCGFSR